MFFIEQISCVTVAGKSYIQLPMQKVTDAQVYASYAQGLTLSFTYCHRVAYIYRKLNTFKAKWKIIRNDFPSSGYIHCYLRYSLSKF